jgi:hypothetical protein
VHSLEVIVARNERAVAREEAHAFNDHDFNRVQAIQRAEGHEDDSHVGYTEAYLRAREEK